MRIVDAAIQLAHARKTESSASPQLRQAADQFEASFLQELLKPMTQDYMFGSGSDGASSGSLGTVGSIATQALADGIARDGGLGIAKRVLAELAPVEAAQSGKTVAAEGTKCGGCSIHLPALTSADDQTGAAALQPSLGLLPQAGVESALLPLENVEKFNASPQENTKVTPHQGR